MITEHHLTGFKSMHAGFRHEFGRLADACRAPRDAAHATVLEEQIALVMDVLHAHHTHEDENLWPHLLACAPSAAAELDALEAEHEVLDPLITGSQDRSLPWSERAVLLQRLHDVVNDHLDHEERVAFPLMLTYLTPEDIAGDRRKAQSEFGRRRLPLVFGWIASCCDEELLADALGEQPRLARVLFRHFWWPSYSRRFRLLYGADAPLANSLLPA
jgi:hypothetical protein